jgi:diguanylate cyclase (GGDEF)-like protein
MPKTPIKILLVEDRDDEAFFIESMFSRSPDIDATIVHVTRVSEAIAQCSNTHYDITLLDLGLPDNVGVTAVEKLRRCSPRTPIFVLTGDERREVAMASIEAGAQDYLSKQHLVGQILTRMTEHSIARQRRLLQAEELALKDVLTGIPNRRCFSISFEQMKSQGDPFWVALIDIDKFKRINDRFGHDTGDEVIRDIAQTLTQAAIDAHVARYGGEEFAVLFSEKSTEKASQFLDHLRTACEKIRIANSNEFITVSIGSTNVQKADDERSAFRRADAAMYTSKVNGRNQWNIQKCIA